MLKSASKFSTGGPPEILLTEFIVANVPRQWCTEFKKAKQEEIDRLLKRKAFIKVHKKNIPEGSNILRGILALSFKNIGAPDETHKACFVEQKYADLCNNILVYESVNITQQTIRISVAIAVLTNYRL